VILFNKTFLIQEGFFRLIRNCYLYFIPLKNDGGFVLMENQKLVVYPYRWVILAVFMLIMAVQQLLWITFASITSSASAFYGVSNMSIGLLSIVFMIAYIIVSIPSSWLIDTYGFRTAAGLGAVITGIFGLLRGIFASSYTMVLIFQIGIAIGQPLILNAVTTVAARWFPIKERATATGISWLAGYAGLIAGLAVTPYLTIALGIPKMLIGYGIVSLVTTVAFLIFAKEKPPTPQCAPEEEERSLVFDGLKQLIVKKQFILLMAIFFIGLGVFNALATWIEDILRPRGFSSTQAGVIGGVMIACGVLGSGIIPLLSDKFRNRTRFIILAMAGSIPGMIGITYATDYWLLLVSAGVLGFFMLSSAPVGFQYGAEIAHPAPEGTSTGMLMMMGQISGILFILGMDLFKSPQTGSMTTSMCVLIGLMVYGALFALMLKESKLLQRSNVKN
jgi:MFS family permease